MSDDPYSNPSGLDNPYGPTAAGAAVELDQAIQLPVGQSRGMVNQVVVLGVLMIIQGVLDLMAGAAAMFYAFFMPQIFEEMQAGAAGGQPPPELPAEFGTYMMIGGALFAAALFVIGILLVVSGIGVIRFQKRPLAIASLCLGLLTLMTCYCFPSSLALGIYGLIVLLNQPVMLAFELRSQGYTTLRIQQAFVTLP